MTLFNIGSLYLHITLHVGSISFCTSLGNGLLGCVVGAYCCFPSEPDPIRVPSASSPFHIVSVSAVSVELPFTLKWALLA